jgi:hypothetical protein
MLTIFSSPPTKTYGSISRRSFLLAGSLCVGGLTLADVLRLQARGAVDRRAGNKAVIMVYLEGGPSHIDLYDLKPDAPAEYRGEYKPIHTKVPGFDICQMFPLQAQVADKLALIRNMKFGNSTHQGPLELETGFARETRPGFGAVVSRLERDAGKPVVLPPYVSFHSHVYTAYLGNVHRPFSPGKELQSLALARGVTLETLNERKDLLRAFDTLNRDLDGRHGELQAKDAFTTQALEMITSSRAREAFDLGHEPEAVRTRYGEHGQQLLQARRLVEAGVKVVSLTFHGVTPEERRRHCSFCAGPWDTHGDTYTCLGVLLPRLDRALSALVTDLHERGLEQDVAVVVWGEFGRAPKIDNELKRPTPGRAHWPEAGFALLAGGGLQLGQVVGATDARGGYPVGRPYRPQNVLATLYRVLGIDPRSTLPDHTGRPIHLLEDPEPIKELV